MLKIMNPIKYCFLPVYLLTVSFCVMAQSDGLFEDVIPVQQFVVADQESRETKDVIEYQEEQEQMAEEASEMQDSPHAYSGIYTDNQGKPIFPARAPNYQSQQQAEPEPEKKDDAQNNQRQAVPLSTLPFDLAGNEEQNPFAGGLDNRSFIVCARMSQGLCTSARNKQFFNECINKMSGQESCKQFVSFANLVGFDRNDEIDLVQYYDQAQLTLIHVKRLGEPYPGDYFIMNASGKLTNITQGAEIQGINIMKDLKYPQIISKFPKAQIWSIVDQLPSASTSPNGGLRLVFRFSLLNGCATCDLAGYANVAYDFTDLGVLQSVSLLSLQPLL